MRHKVAGRTLARTSAHRKELYRNLVTDLLNHEKITTSEAKAKEIRSLAEQMITLGKKGGLPSRRKALSFILDEKITEKVFAEIATRYAERQGGYTRITKLGPRQGDRAPMVKIELV